MSSPHSLPFRYDKIQMSQFSSHSSSKTLNIKKERERGLEEFTRKKSALIKNNLTKNLSKSKRLGISIMFKLKMLGLMMYRLMLMLN